MSGTSMLKTGILGLLTALTLAALGAAIAATTAGERPLTKAHRDKELNWVACPAPFLPDGCQLALLRGDPRQSSADVFVKLPPGSQVPSHTHTSPERVLMVAGELKLLYDGQQPVWLKPGMYAYGPAKQPHEATCTSREPCVVFINFETPLDAMRYTKGAQ